MLKLSMLALLVASVGVSEDQLRDSGITPNIIATPWALTASFKSEEDGEIHTVVITQAQTQEKCNEIKERNRQAAAEVKVILACEQLTADEN